MANLFNNPISAFRRISNLSPEERQKGWVILVDAHNSFHVYTFQSRNQLAEFIMQVEEENAINPVYDQAMTFAALGRFATFFRSHLRFSTFLHLYIKMEEPTTSTERWENLRKFMDVEPSAS
jgi:hypothetical protein